MSKSVTVGEFVLDLLVDAGKGELTVNGLIASMGQLEVASVGEIAILFELAQKLASLAEHAVLTTLGIEHITSSTGMSTKALQQWTAAAAYVNISGETMAGTLANISHNLALGRRTGEYGGLLDLGVILSKSGKSLADFNAEHPEKLIEFLRSSTYFQGLKKADQWAMLGGSGLRDILEILQKTCMSKEQLDEAFAHAPIISDEDQVHYDDLYRQFVNIKQLSLSIGEVMLGWVGDALLGKIKNVLTGIQDIDAWLTKKDKEGKQSTVAGYVANDSDLKAEFGRELKEFFTHDLPASFVPGWTGMGPNAALNPDAYVSPDVNTNRPQVTVIDRSHNSVQTGKMTYEEAQHFFDQLNQRKNDEAAKHFNTGL